MAKHPMSVLLQSDKASKQTEEPGKASSGATLRPAAKWNSINWKKTQREVIRLHIFKSLYKCASTKIVRRVKIRMHANPFDPAQASYFAMRAKSKGMRETGKSWKQHRRDQS